MAALLTVEADELTRQKLCEILETYGRLVCDEPQRCEALLRDLCPGHRREVFLLVAALRERVVFDLLSSTEEAPEEIVVPAQIRKLCENLGLAEDAARWAVESWLFAVRKVPPSAFQTSPLTSRTNLLSTEVSEEDAPLAPGAEVSVHKFASVDWTRLNLCFGAILCCCAAVLVVARASFYHNWSSLGEWFLESLLLAAGLGMALAGETWIAQRLRQKNTLGHGLLDPGRAPLALLPEILALLIQPLVVLSVPALWLGEWFWQLHVAGGDHDLAFHLGRLIQSLLIGVFLYKWIAPMTTIQGQITCSAIC